MKEFQQIGRTISDKKRYERFYGIIPQRLSGKKVLPEKDIKKIDNFRSFVSENTLKLIRTEERIIKNSPHSINNFVSISDCDDFIPEICIYFGI